MATITGTRGGGTREMALRSNAAQYGPLMPATLLVPLVKRFYKEYGVEDKGRNELGLSLVDVVGDSTARKLRSILAGEMQFIGIYKADQLLCKLGYCPHVVQEDPQMRAAFETPDGQTFAYTAEQVAA